MNKEVCEVLQTMGEKSRIEACGVGKQRSSKIVKPVKVTAASSTVISQILTKSKNLRKSENFQSVFIYISTDRSVEQRSKNENS